MIALNRWIALAPMAALVLVGFSGCQTGTKRCHETRCSTMACSQAKPCHCSKVACGATGCVTLPPAQALPHPPAQPAIPSESKAIPQDPQKIPGPPMEEQPMPEVKPIPEEKAADLPFTPEPVTQAVPQPGSRTPVVTVSETRQSEPVSAVTSHKFRTRVSARAAIDPNADDQSYQVPMSRPWSDALGLPSENSQEVEFYRGN